jgi:oxygen-independent coproporphyrinogen-3 oxidase
MEQGIQSDKIEHIYVHVPFCLKKCPYCSFYSVKFDHSLLDKYQQALIKEIHSFKDKYDLLCKTLYLGGGTPSLLPIEKLGKIISEFDINSNAEITIEANPYTISNDKAEKWAELGINRVSIGAQSFLDKELRLLGRLHSCKDIYEAINILRSKELTNLSLDLIYGLPYQTCEDVRYSLREICKLQPNHVSTYCLSLDPTSELYSYRHLLPSDDMAADIYEEIGQTLSAVGYIQYEISNFAMPGYESRHNLAYWQYRDFIGLGASAHGRIYGYAYENPSDIDEYIETISNDKIMVSNQHLSRDECEKEYIIMNLRTAKGVNLEEFGNKFKAGFIEKYADILEIYLKQSYLIVTEDHIRLAPKAYFISNSILMDFV